MASDPYGYPDTASSTVDPATASSNALWSGMGALICMATAPCACYMPAVVALPLSIAALYYASKGSASAVEAERSSATAGLVSGVIGLILSLFGVMLLTFYALYFLVIMAAVVAGAASGS